MIVLVGYSVAGWRIVVMFRSGRMLVVWATACCCKFAPRWWRPKRWHVGRQSVCLGRSMSSCCALRGRDILLSYFFIAGHHHFARYPSWHCLEMSVLPDDLMAGSFVCRHKAGRRNSVPSDQFGTCTHPLKTMVACTLSLIVGGPPGSHVHPPPPRAEPKWYQNDRLNLLFQNRDVPIKQPGPKTPNLHTTRWPP